MRVLLVEDDPVLIDGLTHALKQSGYDVTSAVTAAYAEGIMLAKDFDLIILDLGLPDMCGKKFLCRLRMRKIAIPVLILTARDALNERIESLQKGADDYMVKPFDLSELEIRIHALLRRSYGSFSKDIVCGRLTLDILGHQVFADDELLILFSREYGILELLMLQLGRVISKDKIAQRLATGDDELGDNAIEVIVHRLRKRIQPYGVRIKTLRGLGYMLEGAPDLESDESRY
ncbi:MAG: response regulator [Gammaproteobacteria bacterium]